MAIDANDLRPSRFKVTVKGKEYWSNPPRMAHRIILMKVKPLFDAIALLADGKDVDVDSTKILEYQADLDVLFQDLIPELKDVTLDEMALVELIEQLVENSMPEESKQLKAAKVEVNGDPKAPKIG